MKIFLNWFILSLLVLLVLTFSKLVFDDHANFNFRAGLMVLVVGSLFLAALFYYLQVTYIPKRKENLTNKIIETFGAYPIADHITRFNINNLTVYTQIDIHLMVSEHHSYTEKVQFHIPQDQIDRLPVRHSFRKATCNGIDTYIVYESAGRQLNRTAGKFYQEIAQLTNTQIK